MPEAQQNPLISVIIPVYNRAHEIGRALESVRVQAYPNLEIIVVDDGSNDDLKGGLSHFRDMPITLLHHETRQGAGAARNTGIRAAKGEYIALLDSDDEWLPGKLDHQITLLRSGKSDARLLCSGYILTWDETGRQESRIPQPCATYRRLLMGCDLSPGSTLFAARRVFDEYGLFDETLERLEDWDWLLRYLKTGQVSVVPEPLVRIHLSPRPPLDMVQDSTRRLFRKHRAWIMQNSIVDSLKFLSSLLVEGSASAFYERKYFRAMWFLSRAVVAWPFRNLAFYNNAIRRMALIPSAKAVSTSLSERPRIMHVITGLDTGGAEKMLTDLAIANHHAGESPLLVSLLPGGARHDNLVKAGVQVKEVGLVRGRPGLRGLFRLVDLIRVEKPDIIQSWMYHADLYSLIALMVSGRRRQTRLYWGIRCSNMDTAQYGLTLRVVIRVCAWLSFLPDGIVANSMEGRSWHLRIGYKPKLFTVIDNGLNVSLYQATLSLRHEARAELGIDRDAFVIGALARNDPMKDYPNLLAALEKLDGVVCIVAGRGTKKLPKKPGLICLGERQDALRILHAMDVFISASAYGEGFSNAIAEAMSCELPVIATNVGDSSRIVGDCGIIVRQKNSNALAEAIKKLQRDPALRHDLGRRSRQRITEEFSLQRMVSAYKDFYHDPQFFVGGRESPRAG
ncbi:MAG: glycosyltransferase [Alphaproteobacteria bacterium]|nr:glycosyltransferase [Alphaproteobacteria bacterium]